jgi:hypothetical protein
MLAGDLGSHLDQERGDPHAGGEAGLADTRGYFVHAGGEFLIALEPIPGVGLISVIKLDQAQGQPRAKRRGGIGVPLQFFLVDGGEVVIPGTPPLGGGPARAHIILARRRVKIFRSRRAQRAIRQIRAECPAGVEPHPVCVRFDPQREVLVAEPRLHHAELLALGEKSRNELIRSRLAAEGGEHIRHEMTGASRRPAVRADMHCRIDRPEPRPRLAVVAFSPAGEAPGLPAVDKHCPPGRADGQAQASAGPRPLTGKAQTDVVDRERPGAAIDQNHPPEQERPCGRQAPFDSHRKPASRIRPHRKRPAASVMRIVAQAGL